MPNQPDPNKSQRRLDSLEPLDSGAPRPIDLGALERLNAQLDKLPASAPATPQLPPTMASYEPPQPRRKSSQAAGSSRMLLGICLGAGAAVIILIAGFFLLRGIDLRGITITVADADTSEDETSDTETTQPSTA